MFSRDSKKQCRRLRDMLSEYIDNRLEGKDRALVEGHLETCDACARELESLRMTVGLLQRVPQVAAPRSFAIREMELESERVSVFDPRRLGWLRPATAVVTIALVALLMVDFLQVLPHDAGVRDGGVPEQTYVQSMASPPDGGNVTVSGSGNDQLPVPSPAPALGAEDKRAVEGGGVFGSEAEASGVSEGGVPLREIEIAVGVLVFVLILVTVYVGWRRRQLGAT